MQYSGTPCPEVVARLTRIVAFIHTMNGASQPGGLIQIIRYGGGPSPAQPSTLPRPAPPFGGGGHGRGH